MGEFRIGRKFAQHSYPESRRDSTLAFARNSAQGPGGDAPVPVTTGGTQILWETIESGGGPSEDVPITPLVTGRIRIIAMVAVTNTIGVPTTVKVVAQVEDVTIPGSPVPEATVDESTDAGNGFETITYVFDTTLLPVGATKHIEILVTAGVDNAIELTLENSTLDIQELPAATG